MRLRRGRTVTAGSALAVLAGALVVLNPEGPAQAAATCRGQEAHIIIALAGNWRGSQGDDVVVISADGVTYDPVHGKDLICITAPGGATVWYAGGSGHEIRGGPGPDFIYGSGGPDKIFGGGGDDVIKGNEGDDAIEGGAGNDYIRGGDGHDRVWSGDGADCVLGGNGWDGLYGGPGNDTLLLGYTNRYSAAECAPAENDNSSSASAFRNNLDSDGGVIWGENGADRAWGSNGKDNIVLHDGNDIGNGWSGDDTIEGGPGTDVLKGGNGVDSVHGGAGLSDQVYGGGGTGDQLYGDIYDLCFPDHGPAIAQCQTFGG